MAAINDETEFLARLNQELVVLGSEINNDRLSDAIETSLSELSYDYPLSGIKKVWAVRRAKRHAIFIYIYDVVTDFDYDQTKLSQQYHQLKDLIRCEDQDFEDAIVSEPELFDVELSAGTVIGNGNNYTITGEDVGLKYPVETIR